MDRPTASPAGMPVLALCTVPFVNTSVVKGSRHIPACPVKLNLDRDMCNLDMAMQEQCSALSPSLCPLAFLEHVSSISSERHFKTLRPGFSEH